MAHEPSPLHDGKTIDLSRITPELAAALVKAQAAASAVGKDGTNTQRGYRYATSESITEEARKCFASAGLAFLDMWTQYDPGMSHGDIGKQFVGARVEMRWVLMHEGGGIIEGRADIDAVCSPARPPDKAVAAAVTYGRGFVLRGLLNLARADAEDVDQRRDEEQTAQDRKRWEDEQKQCHAAMAKYFDHPDCPDEKANWRAVCEEAIGKKWPNHPTVSDFQWFAGAFHEAMMVLKRAADAADPTLDQTDEGEQ